MCVLSMMYDLYKYLRGVAIVSQLIPFLFITWDCVKMTLLAKQPQCCYASKSCLDTWEISSIVGITHTSDDVAQAQLPT